SGAAGLHRGRFPEGPQSVEGFSGVSSYPSPRLCGVDPYRQAGGDARAPDFAIDRAPIEGRKAGPEVVAPAVLPPALRKPFGGHIAAILVQRHASDRAFLIALEGEFGSHHSSEELCLAFRK